MTMRHVGRLTLLQHHTEEADGKRPALPSLEKARWQHLMKTQNSPSAAQHAGAASASAAAVAAGAAGIGPKASVGAGTGIGAGAGADAQQHCASFAGVVAATSAATASKRGYLLKCRCCIQLVAGRASEWMWKLLAPCLVGDMILPLRLAPQTTRAS
jgi:hypothetical protein